MRNLQLLFCSLLFLMTSWSQCTPTGTLTLGGCLTGQGFPQSDGGFVTGCNGGSNPSNVFQFTAPATCVDFDITNIAGNGTGASWQYRIINSACALVATGGCIENVDNGLGFTIGGDNISGAYTLTAGSTYYLQLMGNVAGTTYNICMSNTVEPSNSCAGALGLGTTTTTYYNGGAGCSFDGTQTGGAGDPTAATMCAGSLENTQWVNFSPVAGSTSFQVIGTSIDCTGGACAYQFGIFSAPSGCSPLTPEGCVSNGNSCGAGPDPNSANPAPAGTTGTYTMAWTGVSATGFTGTVTIASGTFTGTEEFYLVMDGNAGASCTYTLQGVNVVPLPIELIYFTVKKLNNGNLIKFEIASQKNNDYFSIERSEDGENWVQAGYINGLGNSDEQIKYSFLDTEYRHVINYYRLKQVDFNGQSTYSDIVVVDNKVIAKEITACYDLQGRITTVDASGIVIIQYVDGTSEKIYNP